MKTTIWLTCLGAVTLMLSGCYTPPPPVAYSPPQTISAGPVAPPPVVVEPVAPPATGYAPEYYTWDGNEYVGVSGGNYVYWNGAVWVAAPPIIIGRFHGWERYHPDWHRHAYRYHYEHRHY